MNESKVTKLFQKGLSEDAIAYILDWDIGRVRMVLNGDSDPGGSSTLESAIGAQRRGSGDNRALKCDVCGRVRQYCNC